ncbi:hypothetical protein RvVAR031_09170 [Agrobacterium vitis]|nr:hypothetical protein RvVAR031_09170 [Agrobacterium vitis]
MSELIDRSVESAEIAAVFVIILVIGVAPYGTGNGRDIPGSFPANDGSASCH